MKEKNSQDEIVECPICHIKLRKKEVRLHNIKCRMVYNQNEKDKNKTNDLKNNTNPKDEFKNFMNRVPNMVIDDKNIKTLIKNFILIFGNKIELLEKNIQEITKQIKAINEKNSSYFKKINDSLDNIKNNYKNQRDDNNKPKKRKSQNENLPYKSLFNKIETDVCVKQNVNNKNKNKVVPNHNIKEDVLRSEANNNNFYYSKKSKKIQYASGTNIFENKKEIIPESKNNNIKSINNNKYTEIIDKKNKEEIKYKKRMGDDFYENGNNYTMTESKNNEQNLNKDFQVYMRRSLSFGDLKNLTDKKNNIENGKNEESDDGNYNENDILVDSLDIIMEKIGNLEKTLLNLGLNDEEIKEQFLNLKSKDFEYSNSESFHSAYSEENAEV